MPESANERQPLDQRHLMFALLATLVLMVFNPWRRPPVDGAAAPGDDRAPAAEGADAGEANTDPPATNLAPRAAGGQPAGDAAPLEDEPAAAPQRLTLGGLEEDGPFRMLATLSNTGAAVERIELASSDFRDLDDRSGYLGSLGGEPADGGVRVTVVGPGTPAEAAGVRVGDVITKIASPKLKEPVNDGVTDTPAVLDALLAQTKPKQQITLTIGRSEGPVELNARLTRRPLALIRPESENIRLHSEKLPGDFKPRPSYLVTLDSVGDLTTKSPEVAAANRALLDETWSVEAEGPGEVVFRKRLPGLRLEVVKRFRLPEVPEQVRADRAYRGYHLDLDVEIVNLAAEQQSVAYTVEGANGLPIEGWWYSYKVGPGMFTRYGVRDVVARYAGSGPSHFACSAVARDEVQPMGQGASMAYIGVDAQYFAAAVIPEKESLADVRLRVAEARLATPKLPGDDSYVLAYNNPTCTATTRPIDVPAGKAWKDGYVLFAGPKRPELLAAYFAGNDANYSLEGFAYYGWFGPVARLMLFILHGFYSIVGNYGLAIVLLTVLVRGCMHPISRKQAQSMAKMQELKPEMDRIAQKHKDDRQKQAQAQHELFRKHGVNPLGGCLPMLLQLPIFVGLFRALAVDIELRQAPLISDSVRWCSNLAAPDMLISWRGVFPEWFDNGQGIFALGPFFNILPIATVALILVQQKMFMPQATSPEQEMQQKIMKYMMAFMGLLFFKWASGLAIYFITTSLWGIAERKMLPKPGANGPAPAAKNPPPRPGSSGGSAKPSGGKPSSGKPSGGKRKKPKKRK